MPQGSRSDRIGDQLRMEISELLAREVKDPGIGFVTITHVAVTSDLQHAKVYYTALGDEKARRESAKALARVVPFLRHQLGRRLHLRRIPELTLAFDESIERQDRIERLLNEIHAAQTDVPASEPQTGPASAPPDGPQSDPESSHDD